MKLLVDENLSYRLVARLANEYPGSVHARDVGLRGASDRAVWDYAREHGFAIVSKDNHFRQRSFVDGPPPKVVWLDVGNEGTEAIAALLHEQVGRILLFEGDEEAALLVLSSPRPAT